MLLRSSSTPVLGSRISTITECPNNSHLHQLDLHTTTTKHATPCCNKLSCTTSNGGSQNVSKSVLNSPSVSEIKGQRFRRVQSEGNLEELANASYNLEDQLAKKFARKPNFSSLEPIPSFSHHRLGADFDESDEEDFEEDDEIEEGQNGNYSLRIENMLAKEVLTRNMSNYGSENEGKMYLAAGLGMSDIAYAEGGRYGGGGSFRPVAFSRGDGGGGDHHGVSMEEHYKKMMEGNPGNPLVLRNYAQFLCQTKGDLSGAEEYYSRAILADPEDGEILSQYAKIIWELHHDSERATAYFERAIQVSSEDSHIHAAYASFLWDIEDDEDEIEEENDHSKFGMPLVHHGIMASASA